MGELGREELEIEFNSRFDYIHEAYGATARDCNDMAELDGYCEARDEGFEGTFEEWKARSRRVIASAPLGWGDETTDDIPF